MSRLSRAAHDLESFKQMLAFTAKLVKEEMDSLEKATVKIDDSKQTLRLHASSSLSPRLQFTATSAEKLLHQAMSGICERATASAIEKSKARSGSFQARGDALNSTCVSRNVPAQPRSARSLRASDTIGVTAPSDLWNAALGDCQTSREVKAEVIRTLLRNGLARFNCRLENESTARVWQDMKESLAKYHGPGKQCMARMDTSLYCQLVVYAHEHGASASSFSAMCIAFGLLEKSEPMTELSCREA